MSRALTEFEDRKIDKLASELEKLEDRYYSVEDASDDQMRSLRRRIADKTAELSRYLNTLGVRR